MSWGLTETPYDTHSIRRSRTKNDSVSHNLAVGWVHNSSQPHRSANEDDGGSKMA